MSKRFTDTDKWKNPWYRKLPPAMRELWNYILDSCDHAGIWMEDLELAGMFLGYPINFADYQRYLGCKIIRLEEEKVLIPSFIETQYGVLNSENRVHQSVIQQLTRYSVNPWLLRKVPPPLLGDPEGPSKELARTCLGPKDKDKEVETEKEIGEGGMGETSAAREASVPVISAEKHPPPRPPPRIKFDFEAIYREYPRKEGKQVGLATCKAKIKTQAEYDELLQAVKRYGKHCEQEKTDTEFIKHFSTFVNKNQWRDWLDPATGSSVNGLSGEFSIGKLLAERDGRKEGSCDTS